MHILEKLLEIVTLPETNKRDHEERIAWITLEGEIKKTEKTLGRCFSCCGTISSFCFKTHIKIFVFTKKLLCLIHFYDVIKISILFFCGQFIGQMEYLDPFKENILFGFVWNGCVSLAKKKKRTTLAELRVMEYIQPKPQTIKVVVPGKGFSFKKKQNERHLDKEKGVYNRITQADMVIMNGDEARESVTKKPTETYNWIALFLQDLLGIGDEKSDNNQSSNKVKIFLKIFFFKNLKGFANKKIRLCLTLSYLSLPNNKRNKPTFIVISHQHLICTEKYFKLLKILKEQQNK
ncbi:hypothetical protein RFI_01753 [Reticulomyxa filosa]|uniref:Uncharacterized protein n=1 Tax=Reticulomyxa filosa TaxID=46433 RepID=X6PAY5_RETFI|nr:hypothetical protein RFI_01753 [Reticulomyxa filosa]|eukprot:ETO35311.1 hypothetical protein RFI_01753 [Reticulomyxa filosa]